MAKMGLHRRRDVQSIVAGALQDHRRATLVGYMVVPTTPRASGNFVAKNRVVTLPHPL
jgi:hypothetical protein